MFSLNFYVASVIVSFVVIVLWHLITTGVRVKDLFIAAVIAAIPMINLCLSLVLVILSIVVLFDSWTISDKVIFQKWPRK